MSEYSAIVKWHRGEDDFAAGKYSRAHDWHFDGGEIVKASAAPQIVPTPWSDPAGVDPEEAFIAALSSCHMLFFLDLAARKGLVVDSYTDHATGVLARGEDGKQRMSTVTLNPQVQYGGTGKPDPEIIEQLHHRAHSLCFIANSVITKVSINV